MWECKICLYAKWLGQRSYAPARFSFGILPLFLIWWFEARIEDTFSTYRYVSLLLVKWQLLVLLIPFPSFFIHFIQNLNWRTAATCAAWSISWLRGIQVLMAAQSITKICIVARSWRTCGIAVEWQRWAAQSVMIFIGGSEILEPVVAGDMGNLPYLDDLISFQWVIPVKASSTQRLSGFDVAGFKDVQKSMQNHAKIMGKPCKPRTQCKDPPWMQLGNHSLRMGCNLHGGLTSHVDRQIIRYVTCIHDLISAAFFAILLEYYSFLGRFQLIRPSNMILARHQVHSTLHIILSYIIHLFLRGLFSHRP